jgi:predicted DNA-binding transcriptional regulator AlpA
VKSIDVYPGTHQPIGSRAPTPLAPRSSGWDENPIYRQVQGYMREFFGVGHLSKALGRSVKTIYKWETEGLFPKATFIYNGASRNGQRRLYTRAQIEGALRIAEEEGILTGRVRYLGQTLFPTRCADLFRTTKGILPPPITEWSTQ